MTRTTPGKRICICIPKRFSDTLEIGCKKVDAKDFYNCPLVNGKWATGKKRPKKAIQEFLDFAIAMGWTNLAHLGWYFMTKDFGGVNDEKKPI